MNLNPILPTPPIPAAQPAEPVRAVPQVIGATAVKALLADLTEISAAIEAEPQPAAPNQALKAALQDAIGRQNGLAPLLADLAQGLKSGALPPRVQQAALQLVAQAPPLAQDVTGPAVQQALLRSGLFLESRLARLPADEPLGDDLKAALLSLRAALRATGEAPSRPPGRPPAPPFRDAPTTGQPSAQPSLPKDASPALVAGRLSAETDAALARHELLQIASLPLQSPDRMVDDIAARWMFEAPVQTPQGQSVAQFEISRDGAGPGRPVDAPPVWRARFSLDVEPLGPVHASLALSGDDARVVLWAERGETVQRLRSFESGLRLGLALAALKPEISIYAGAPPPPAPRSGRFLDQTL